MTNTSLRGRLGKLSLASKELMKGKTKKRISKNPNLNQEAREEEVAGAREELFLILKKIPPATPSTP